MKTTYQITETKTKKSARFRQMENNGGRRWVEGQVAGYTYYAAVYPCGSEYGINESNVSKLSIRDNNQREVAVYDRGWDVLPENKFIVGMVDAIVEYYAPKFDTN
ncbi:MAG: DUF7678 domain-containing protein [Thermoguttaceae bacterium]